MSKKDKLLTKLCAIPPPKNFKWHDLEVLMRQFGFKPTCGGGSHYMFEHISSGFSFHISKTHPSGILKSYQVCDVKDVLKHIGAI